MPPWPKTIPLSVHSVQELFFKRLPLFALRFLNSGSNLPSVHQWYLNHVETNMLLRNLHEHASLTPPISPNGDSGHQSTCSSVNWDSRHQLKSRLKSSSRQDRCCNLVVTGISECPQGTCRTERALHDQDSIISVLSPLCPSLATHSIRDLLRLGKYNVHGSRPIIDPWTPQLFFLTHVSYWTP